MFAAPMFLPPRGGGRCRAGGIGTFQLCLDILIEQHFILCHSTVSWTAGGGLESCWSVDRVKTYNYGFTGHMGCTQIVENNFSYMQVQCLILCIIPANIENFSNKKSAVKNIFNIIIKITQMGNSRQQFSNHCKSNFSRPLRRNNACNNRARSQL